MNMQADVRSASRVYSSVSQWRRAYTFVTAMTALCALLVAINLQRPSYWIDEKISVDIAFAGNADQVIRNAIQGERRPPAYHLGLWVWSSLVGQTEYAARLFSGLWIIALVPVAFQLARRLADEHVALLAAFLVATSPILVAYGQTVRYYTLVATLAALSYLFFWDLLHRARKPWIGYALVTAALLYADYPAYGVVIAQNVLAVVWWRQPAAAPDHPRRKWIGVQLALAAFAAMWLPAVLSQGTRDFGTADLSTSLAGGLLRIAYPIYAWSIGETVFPWSPLAILGSALAGVLLLRGFACLSRRDARLFWIVAFGVPFAISQILLATVATDSPFVNAPARSMACAALLSVALGAGLASIRSRRLLGSALIGLSAVHGAALLNYYRGVDFVNPIYNTPARSVADAIAAQAAPGDVVVSESDALVDYYLPKTLRADSFYPEQSTDLRAYLSAHPNKDVWMVVMGRDRTRTDVSARLGDWLLTQFQACGVTGFGEQDETYRRIKAWLIGRDAYQYRLALFHYCPAPPPAFESTPR